MNSSTLPKQMEDLSWFTEHEAHAQKLIRQSQNEELVAYCKHLVSRIERLDKPVYESALLAKRSALTYMSMAYSLLDDPRKALSAAQSAHRITLALPFQNMEVYNSFSLLSRRYAAAGDVSGQRNCAIGAIASLCIQGHGMLISDLISELAELGSGRGSEGSQSELQQLAKDLRAATTKIYIPRNRFNPEVDI